MRAFFAFKGLFLFAAIVSGLLTYPVWSLLQGYLDVPIHRVMNRIGLLVLAIATLLLLRRQGLATKAALGYGVPRPYFLRQAAVGYMAGLLLIIPLAAALYGMDLRVPSARYLASDAQVAFVISVIAKGLLTGCAVAFIEETFCRGALFAAIHRESGLVLAALLSTSLYAATHFLGAETKLPTDQYTYISGLQVAGKLFERFARPVEFVDSFLALAAFGALLVLIRIRTGTIATCIGLHAGAVTVIMVIRRATSLNSDASLSWLVGSYDGMVGWLAFAWIGTVTFVYWRLTRTDRQERPLAATVPITETSYSR